MRPTISGRISPVPAIFTVWLLAVSLAFPPAGSARETLRVQIQPLGSLPRAGGPLSLQVTLERSAPGVLNGRLELEIPPPANLVLKTRELSLGPGARNRGGLATMTFFFWIVASLSITICAVHLIPNERSQRTLDVLLTTPLSGREILSQKIRGLNRLKLLFAIPFMTCVFMRAYVEAVVFTGGRALLYIAVSGLTFLLYMALFSWLALWLGLKIRNRGRAALTAVLGLTLWCAVPLFYFGYGTWLVFLGPATLIRLSEAPLGFYGGSLIGPAVFNYVLYAALWAGSRHHCLANADRLLGRTPVKGRSGLAVR